MICTEEEKKHLGIDQLLQACVCRSPQGRALKERQDFYTISDREALREEFRAIAGIRASLSELAPQWRSAESILGRRHCARY